MMTPSRIGALGALVAVLFACQDQRIAGPSVYPDKVILGDGDTLLTNDPSVDDRLEIQGAINSRPPGGTVFLQGTWIVNGYIYLKSNTRISGSSQGTIRTGCSSPYKWGIFTIAQAGTSRQLSNVAIDSLNVEGYQTNCDNPTGNSDPSQDTHHEGGLIEIDYSNLGNFHIENLRIRGNYIHHVNGSAIEIFTREHQGPAGILSLGYVEIRDNVVRDLGRSTNADGIEVEGSYRSTNGPILVSGNTVEYIGYDPTGIGSGFGIVVSDFTDAQIIGNTVNYTCEDGIRVNSSVDVDIRNNVSIGYLQTSPDRCDPSGVKASESMQVVIANNHVEDKRLPLIEVLGSEEVDVLENTVANGLFSGIQVWPAAGRKSEHVDILRNYVHNVFTGISAYAREEAPGFSASHINIRHNEVSGTCRALLVSRDESPGTDYPRRIIVSGNELLATSARCTPGFNANSVILDGTGYDTITYNIVSHTPNRVYAWDTLVDDNCLISAGCLSVAISGPTEVYVKANYQWSAVPSGGWGYSYQWFVRDRNGITQLLGTTSVQSKTVNGSDETFEMGVIVSSGGYSITESISVTECIDSPCMPAARIRTGSAPSERH